ncbi:MAG: hypothetical protein ACRCTQ_00845 [Brevinemataceae bacterium]
MTKNIALHKFYTIGATIFIIVLMIVPAISNYKYNDHSKNWLNHDYGKNLLASTEEYSIFMTEGGDNQVFSSLYFTYAEKLRQDLFPYDQKGNIFKRIYGDLRYVSYNTMEERSLIVNKGLFTGQEPFYTEIRSSAPPYLVPYPLGRPATYLTWQLKNPQNLGDFYYKNYGQMYKVQHIRFAIVDYVEKTESSSISEVRQLISEKLARPILDQEWKTWIAQLIQDNLIKINKNNIEFVQSYPKPFKKDPTEFFIRRWEKIPNLFYYDYLSREIVTSFAYEQLSLLSDQIKYLELLQKREQNQRNKEKINQEIQDKWKQILYYAETAEKIGHDSSSILHNLGIFYLTAQNQFEFITEDYSTKSIELWESVTKNFKYSWSTYNVLLWTYLQQALKNPDSASIYLESFNVQVNQMTNAMMHWKSMKTNITKTMPYKNSQYLIHIANNFDIIGGKKFDAMENQVKKCIEEPADQINTENVKKYIESSLQRLNFQSDPVRLDALYQLWYKLWTKKNSDPEYFLWHIQIMAELAQNGWIEPVSFTQILQESRNRISQLNLNQQIQALVFLAKTAKLLNNQTLLTFFTNKFVTDIKNNIPKENYDQLYRQFNELVYNENN